MPRKKLTTADRLSRAADHRTLPKTTDSPDQMMRALALHPSGQEACALIREQAAHVYDAEHAHATVQLELQLEQVEAQFSVSQARLDGLNAKLANTPRDIKAVSGQPDPPATDSDAGGAASPQPVPFLRWRLQDKISMLSIYPTAIIALGIGAANVFANVMASGQAVFIEHPVLAGFLAALPPAGSIALKFVGGFFEYSRTKKRYALLIYIATAITLLAWCITFALNFSGVTGGIDWDSLGETNGKGSLFVGLQLIAELLVAAALFLAAEDIALRYAPDTFVENPDFINASRVLTAHRSTHDAVAETRSDLTGRLRQARAAREAAINARVSAFLAYRARMQQSA